MTRVKTGGSRGSTWVFTEWGPISDEVNTADGGQAEANRRDLANFNASNLVAAEYLRERARTGNDVNNGGILTNSQAGTVTELNEISYIFIGADWECRQLGYRKAINITTEPGTVGYAEVAIGQGTRFTSRARRQIFYEATCWSP